MPNQISSTTAISANASLTNSIFPITPIILCGGSGTRLWPLSRQSFPKQFVPLIGHKSLLQLTLERAHLFGSAPILVGSEAHRFMMLDVLEATRITNSTVILEPIARNTAAAMAMGALHVLKAQASSALTSAASATSAAFPVPTEHLTTVSAVALDTAHKAANSLLLFCPADHHIPDLQLFHDTVMQGTQAALEGEIVTFGVMPTYPSSAYGYIQTHKQPVLEHSPVFKVDCFIEKPQTQKAQELILQGNVCWNAGIFLCTADVLLKALKENAPDILAHCEAAMAQATETLTAQGECLVQPKLEVLQTCRSESIDYAVMEQAQNIALVKFTGQWSDVGSWNAVADLTPADESGNRIEGHGVAHLSKNTFIHAPTRPVVALGTKDLLIIDTPDAILVLAQSHAEQVKEVVAQLQTQNKPQAMSHRKVARPWGWYDSIDMGERFQVKRIGVKPGAALSLQKHHHRAEHWVVVRGTAEVTRGTEVFMLCENQSTYIPIGEIHRLKNPGVVELEMIEIQSGSYLGEDDIVRLEDVYGRVVPTQPDSSL
jgi:mannose-1-phosphate guanylyltransferase/mannose-6-phosphate isomerase